MRRVRGIAAGVPLMCLAVAAAVGCRDSVSRLDRRDRSHLLVEKAEAEAGGGRRESAIELYEKAVEADPDLAAAHLDLAILLHDTGADYAGAIGHYRRYLKLRPGSEKTAMIEGRMNDAVLRLAALIRASDPAGVQAAGESLLRENEALREENRRLRIALSAAKAPAAVEQDVKTASGVRPGHAGGDVEQGHGAAEGQAPAAPRRYVVKSGDTLGGIAREMYGNAAEWKKIHAANRDTLSGPNLLVVGQVLVIP